MDQKVSKETLEIVEEKLSDLEKFCCEEKLPMFACVATGENEFNQHMVSCAIAGRKLKDDKIASLLCIMRGFEAVPPSEPLEIEM